MKSSKHNRKRRADPQPVTITAEAWRLYKETICQHPPETVALLGGHLSEPFKITEFRFCPPERDRKGNYLASAAHIMIDPNYMNWVIDNEWRPNGKYMLGIWHSHPGGYSRLSDGDPDKNEGDLVFFKSCLEADDSPGRNWNHFIAPITTFDRRGNDEVTLWILDKGSRAPRPGQLILPEASAELAAAENAVPEASPDLSSQAEGSVNVAAFEHYDAAFEAYRNRMAAIDGAQLPWDDARTAREGLRRTFLSAFAEQERGA